MSTLKKWLIDIHVSVPYQNETNIETESEPFYKKKKKYRTFSINCTGEEIYSIFQLKI